MNLYIFSDAIGMATIYGIGSYINELSRALEGANVNVRIVYLRTDRAKFEIVKTKNVENWYIPKIRNENSVTKSDQLFIDFYRNVIYFLRIHIMDTRDLIFHFNINTHYILAKELKAAFDCKTVATAHNTQWGLDLDGNLRRFKMIKTKTEEQRSSPELKLINVTEREISFFKEVDRVIAISYHMRSILNTEYQVDSEKIFLIPNGLSEDMAIKKEKDALRKKWRISEKESLILFAGRLVEVKGVIYLLKAFRKVLEIFPDCRLIIVGNGKYDTYMEEAKDMCTKITFTGLLEKKDLYELYQTADIGVMPSLYEPFGLVAVEMMLHGLPIVATATSGLNEVVDDTCGIKVPVNEKPNNIEIDDSLLAEKILYLLQHPAEARKMGQNGRKRYLKEYSLEVFRRNMLNFYNSL